MRAAPPSSDIFADDETGWRPKGNPGFYKRRTKDITPLRNPERWRDFRTRTVWVMGIPQHTPYEEVKRFAESAGPVHQLRLGRTPGGDWSGVARVVYSDAAAAQRAADTLSGGFLNNADVVVVKPRDEPEEADAEVFEEEEPISGPRAEAKTRAAEHWPERPARRRTLPDIALLNVPDFWSRSDIMGFLAPFGKLVHINNKLYSDGTPSQWVKARFVNRHAALEAVQVLDGQYVDGNQIHVKWDQTKASWQPRPVPRVDEPGAVQRGRWVIPHTNHEEAA